MLVICPLCQQCSDKRKILTKMFRRHQFIHYMHAKKREENQLVQCWTWTNHSFPNHTVKTKIIFQCLYTEDRQKHVAMFEYIINCKLQRVHTAYQTLVNQPMRIYNIIEELYIVGWRSSSRWRSIALSASCKL